MMRMTQDLLDIARCESGTLTAEVSQFLLAPFARKWVEGILPQFERKAQRVQVEIPADLVVAGDPELLRRSFLNLLGNSAKYGARGSATVIKAMTLGEVVHIRIQDDGPGIPDEMREVIFNPFVRLSRDSEQARISSGLGLAFCRAVAQVHGGRIWVEPNDPEGSVFCLELPGVSVPRSDPGLPEGRASNTVLAGE
jgi:signal transduction histidine kinase